MWGESLFYYYLCELMLALSLSIQIVHSCLAVSILFMGGVSMELLDFSLSTAACCQVGQPWFYPFFEFLELGSRPVVTFFLPW